MKAGSRTFGDQGAVDQAKGHGHPDTDQNRQQRGDTVIGGEAGHENPAQGHYGAIGEVDP